MLQKVFEITEQLYNPINHMTQNELMEKFNLAFYEGQNLSKADIISTFKDVNEEISSEDSCDISEGINGVNDDYLIDYLLSNSPVSTPCSDVDINFDFNDFVNDFDQNFSRSTNGCTRDEDFDAETLTESSLENDDKTNIIFPFISTPSISSNKTSRTCLSNLELGEIYVNEELINFEDLPSDLQAIDNSLNECPKDEEDFPSYLTSVETVNKSNLEFNNFLRNAAPDNISFWNQVRIGFTSIYIFLKENIFIFPNT